MKTGITGATGQLGQLVVEKMKQRVDVDQLVALVRSPERVTHLGIDLGIEIKPFDYTKPAILAESLQGIEQLMLISSSEVGQRSAQHRNIIEAARRAGVKRIVYTSLLHADTSVLSLAGEHLETEKMLKESGIPHTVLRNGWYSENYTDSIPGAVEAGAFVGSAGDGKISSATREDFAEAATVVLTNEGHIGKVYELAGDEAYTLKDFAAEISKQTGKDIPYKNLPESKYAGILSSIGIAEGFAQAIASFDVGASKGSLFDDGKVLSQLIGRPTTSMDDAIKKVFVK